MRDLDPQPAAECASVRPAHFLDRTTGLAIKMRLSVPAFVPFPGAQLAEANGRVGHVVGRDWSRDAINCIRRGPAGEWRAEGRCIRLDP